MGVGGGGGVSNMLKSLNQFCQDIPGSIIVVKIKGIFKDNTFKYVDVRSEKKCIMHYYGF